MFAIIEQELGGVDVLVNNAAVDIPNVFEKKTVSDFRKTLDVNLIGAYITAKGRGAACWKRNGDASSTSPRRTA